jgi:hypothetical protein
MSQPFDPRTLTPTPLEFYDEASKRTMLYVYPDTKKQDGSAHWCAGWICYQNPGDGQWVTLRKATDADIHILNFAVTSAHHCEQHTRAGAPVAERPLATDAKPDGVVVKEKCPCCGGNGRLDWPNKCRICGHEWAVGSGKESTK